MAKLANLSLTSVIGAEPSSISVSLKQDLAKPTVQTPRMNWGHSHQMAIHQISKRVVPKGRGHLGHRRSYPAPANGASTTPQKM